MNGCIKVSIEESSKYEVFAFCYRLGRDIVTAFGGGELPHVGAVALAEWQDNKCCSKVLTACGHKETELAVKAASVLAEKCKCNVSATVGLHVDNASVDEIGYLCANFDKCLSELISKMDK